MLYLNITRELIFPSYINSTGKSTLTYAQHTQNKSKYS